MRKSHLESLVKKKHTACGRLVGSLPMADDGDLPSQVCLSCIAQIEQQMYESDIVLADINLPTLGGTWRWPDPAGERRAAILSQTLSEDEILEFAEAMWGVESMERLGIKLAEECGEVAGAIVKIEEGRKTLEDLDDELGDVLIVLSKFAAKRGTTLDDLRAERFAMIKERALHGG